MQLIPEKINNADKIKNIIFDWGGVISNIDYHKSIEAFKKIGLKGFDEMYTQLKQTNLFDNLETGTIEPAEFRNELRAITQADLDDELIDEAWTAMLLDLPRQRLNLLEKVGKHYNIFLLSNTNAIHIQRYSKYIDQVYGTEKFRNLFKKAYLSHEIGMRKPHVEIFQYVLTQNNLSPNETLFIDDTPQHIEGAKKAGLNTFHLKAPITILDLFKNGTA